MQVNTGLIWDAGFSRLEPHSRGDLGDRTFENQWFCIVFDFAHPVRQRRIQVVGVRWEPACQLIGQVQAFFGCALEGQRAHACDRGQHGGMLVHVTSSGWKFGCHHPIVFLLEMCDGVFQQLIHQNQAIFRLSVLNGSNAGDKFLMGFVHGAKAQKKIIRPVDACVRGVHGGLFQGQHNGQHKQVNQQQFAKQVFGETLTQRFSHFEPEKHGDET